jgi:hypothetical protein
MCDKTGVVYKLQSPYSLDLNPIGEHFGETKNFIRKIWNKYEKDIKHNFASFVERCVEVKWGEGCARRQCSRPLSPCWASIDEPSE